MRVYIYLHYGRDGTDIRSDNKFSISRIFDGISGRIISSSISSIFDGVSGRMYPVSDRILNSVSGIRPSTKALASGYKIRPFSIRYIPSRTLVWTLKACCIYKSLSNTLVIRCVKSRAKMFLYLIFPVLPPGGNPLSAAVSHET